MLLENFKLKKSHNLICSFKRNQLTIFAYKYVIHLYFLNKPSFSIDYFSFSTFVSFSFLEMYLWGEKMKKKKKHLSFLRFNHVQKREGKVTVWPSDNRFYMNKPNALRTIDDTMCYHVSWNLRKNILVKIELSFSETKN